MPKTPCGAKTRSGGKCKQPAMPNGKCHLHGGKSLKGIAHPNYQGKGYSKYIPVGLLDTYQEFANAPDKLAMDEQIAIVDTYMAQLLESLGDYSSPELWDQLQEQVIEYKKASDGDKPPLLAYIFDTIEAGASYVSKWDTLHKALEQRRKLVAADRCGAAGSADTLTPGYLLAALDVPGPATWACGGNPVIDLSGQIVITPGEAMMWHGEPVPVTVLVLSEYVPPEKCAVVGAGPAWYADWHRYTCLAYQGEDRNCPGEVHYH